MDSLRQERGFSSGEKDNLGHPSANVNGEHGVAGTQEGAPGTVHRVPGACQAVPGGFVPLRLTPAEAYMGSCQPESCQERLSAPRQRKVTNLSCVPKSIMFQCPKEYYVPKCPKEYYFPKCPKVYVPCVPKRTFQNVPIPSKRVKLLKTPETSVKDFESEERLAVNQFEVVGKLKFFTLQRRR